MDNVLCTPFDGCTVRMDPTSETVEGVGPYYFKSNFNFKTLQGTAFAQISKVKVLRFKVVRTDPFYSKNIKKRPFSGGQGRISPQLIICDAIKQNESEVEKCCF